VQSSAAERIAARQAASRREADAENLPMTKPRFPKWAVAARHPDAGPKYRAGPNAATARFCLETQALAEGFMASLRSAAKCRCR
jgi:hypothetical protein